MFDYLIWLKNRILDTYLNWRYGEVIFTNEEVMEMCEMFSYLVPQYEEGDTVLFSHCGKIHKGQIISVNFSEGEKKFVVESDKVIFGANASYFVSEKQIIRKVYGEK